MDLNTTLKNMKILLKLNPKHHVSNDYDMIPQELIIDTMHIHLELEGLLLSKKGISNNEPKFSLYTICNSSIKNNKMSKLALVDGLWIGIAPITLPKLTMVEETSIARYCCWTTLFKLRYINKGGIIVQHALKGNVVSFAQDLEHAIEILKKYHYH